ncbi:MAG: MOSC domain-containing protein [Pseudomonadota bacterium]
MSQMVISELIQVLPQVGQVSWLGVRPARGAPMLTPIEVMATAGQGLVGDRFSARRTTREVTLIQAEHIAAVAALLQREPVDPGILRRNIVVSQLNLLALKDSEFSVGGVVLAYTGLAHPCSKMEQALGAGGYNAMRGHGGITARILQSGVIRLGDAVRRIGPAK